MGTDSGSGMACQSLGPWLLPPQMRTSLCPQSVRAGNSWFSLSLCQLRFSPHFTCSGNTENLFVSASFPHSRVLVASLLPVHRRPFL